MSEFQGKFLYRIIIDCGRSEYIKSCFLATQQEVDAIVGKKFYISEPFGRFSEANGTYQQNQFSLITTDREIIELLISLEILPTGISPFDHIVD